MLWTYNDCLKMPANKYEWMNEIKGFIKNYEFPWRLGWLSCIISSKMKIFYNFKHRNSVSNMGLVGYNKRFSDLAVGAPALHQLHKKMKFSIIDFSTKCDQIRSFLRIWSHLLKKYCLNKYCKDKFR